ncbi:hypothetical protein DW322_03600 [Rhodococcus rhodnii]|uniref:Uncharacterized protein n=1 Tax=Rhodococcus rhodnii TaxID=38312 RepID=A0A6P2C9P8_9NOCA|nr:hypothetical protein DW322_03600 [Rhodococcus rhodnii]
MYTGAYVQSSPRQLCDGFEQQVIHSAPGYPVFDVHERLARLPVVAARCTVDFADGTTPDRATLVIDWQANLTVLAGVILMIAAVAYHFRHRHDVT